MTQHTPGPWTTIERSSFGSGKKRIQYWYDGGATDVAQVLKPATMIVATYEANARLIAAAPEMLEIIIGYEQFLTDFDHYLPDSDLRIDETLKDIRALLARVEGKS